MGQKNNEQINKFFVLINCYEDEIEQTINDLKKIDCIKEVRQIDGPYDILITLESKYEYELKNMLSNKIKNIETIRSTLTLQSCQKLETEI